MSFCTKIEKEENLLSEYGGTTVELVCLFKKIFMTKRIEMNARKPVEIFPTMHNFHDPNLSLAWYNFTS